MLETITLSTLFNPVTPTPHPEFTRGKESPVGIKSILEICISMLIVNNTVLVTQVWADPMNFVTSWTVARQAPLSMEYRSGWHFPPPGDLPSPGIEPRSPALLMGSLLSELLGKTNDTSLYT